MNRQKFDDYIQKVRWQEAKTYRKTAPHEYTIRWWRKDLEQEFIDVVLFIREHGVKEKFFSKTFIYFYHGDYKYWTMGDPLETTWVLNRALVN
jgi:hypothetical protein